MCGGKVIETLECGDTLWVNCEDGRETCAIYVKKTPAALSISPGDAFWWQSGHAMWTPKNKHGGTVGKKSDIKLERVGFSGVSRPTVAKRLLAHLETGGSLHDLTTQELFREAQQCDSETGTDLAGVSVWALRVATTERARREAERKEYA